MTLSTLLGNALLSGRSRLGPWLMLVPSVCIGQGSWFLFDTSNTNMENLHPSFLVFDQQGGLWTANEYDLGESRGLYHYDGVSWTKYDATDLPQLEKAVRHAASDQQGIMWFTVFDSGLLRFDGTTWSVFDMGNSDIPSNRIFNLFMDGSNTLWMSYIHESVPGGGVARFDGTSWTTWDHTNAPIDPDVPCIWAMGIHNDSLWVGGCHGFVRMDLATETWEEDFAEVPCDGPQALFNDGQGNMWIGYYGALGPPNCHIITRYDGSTWTNYAPWGPDNWVRADGFAVDTAGNILCGSSSGLWSFDGNAWEEFGPVPPPDGISGPQRSVAVSPNGSLWWAVDYQGIWTNDPDATTSIETHQKKPREAYQVVPDPFSTSAVLLPEGLSGSILDLSIVDISGKQRSFRTYRRNDRLLLERGGSLPGLYFFSLSTELGECIRGRFAIE